MRRPPTVNREGGGGRGGGDEEAGDVVGRCFGACYEQTVGGRGITAYGTGRGIIENRHREVFLSCVSEHLFRMVQGQKDTKKRFSETRISILGVCSQ